MFSRDWNKLKIKLFTQKNADKIYEIISKY